MGLSEQVNLDFGFEGDCKSEFTTISGKEQTDVQNLQSISLNEITPGLTYDGTPEISIFTNAPKPKANGGMTKGYDSIRLRLIDETDYLDCYANVPTIPESGFIENIGKNYNFFRSGFDLIFSFMRYLDETSVLTETGEPINHIKKTNIRAICEYIDKLNKVEIKVTTGANDGYNSFIIIDMK